MRLFPNLGFPSFLAAHDHAKKEPQKLLFFTTRVSKYLKESPLYNPSKGIFLKEAKLLVYLLQAPTEIVDAAKTLSKFKGEEERINKFIYALAVAKKIARFFFKIIYVPLVNLSKSELGADESSRNYLIGALSLGLLNLALKIVKVPKKLRPSDFTSIILLTVTIIIVCLKLANPVISKSLVLPLAIAQCGQKTLKIFTGTVQMTPFFSQKYANELS